MNIQEIIKQAEKLSVEEQKDLISYILLKYFDADKETIKKIIEELQVKKEKSKRKLGFLEGTEYYIADDFDTPLNDLKEYM